MLCAVALALAGASAQTEVTRYQPGVTAEGITYCLPRTALKVRVNASCVKYQPGDFRPYAERYLRLSGIPKEPSTSWKIEDVKIYSVGEPDTTKMFSVRLRQKTAAPLVSLTPEGVLVSINQDAPATVSLPAMPKPTATNDNLNPRDYMTQEILAAGSTSKMAELTAAEIYDIRESRSALAKGEADNTPKDGEQLKLMISSLDTQERALLQQFKGTQTRETRSYEFYYLPTKGDSRDVLFRFSKKLGAVDADDMAGEPVYITLKDKHTAPAPAPADPKKKEPEDVRYNVPTDVDVSISSGSNVLAHEVVPMGQFGNVEHLGVELFNKRMDTHVTLSPVTGGIVELKMPEPGK